ncbi:hypothetical protein PIB30_047358 [Stylosanthes scabra]|uniref:Uncharacterized protein n=1 Tax=Stylosanthes scabra TaxID=79078 RepID=A0ABU6UFK2_9FABA|nr:hypothetical protein [Stylosanthes scabra]
MTIKRTHARSTDACTVGPNRDSAGFSLQAYKRRRLAALSLSLSLKQQSSLSKTVKCKQHQRARVLSSQSITAAPSSPPEDARLSSSSYVWFVVPRSVLCRRRPPLPTASPSSASSTRSHAVVLASPEEAPLKNIFGYYFIIKHISSFVTYLMQNTTSMDILI